MDMPTFEQVRQKAHGFTSLVLCLSGFAAVGFFVAHYCARDLLWAKPFELSLYVFAVSALLVYVLDASYLKPTVPTDGASQSGQSDAAKASVFKPIVSDVAYALGHVVKVDQIRPPESTLDRS